MKTQAIILLTIVACVCVVPACSTTYTVPPSAPQAPIVEPGADTVPPSAPQGLTIIQ